MTKSITVPHRWITVTEISKDLSACGIKCCHVIICCSRYHCQSKTAHIKMSETSPSWHFLEEKRSVYTFVCACDTTAIWASVSSCHGWVWCSWGDIPPSSPLSQSHLSVLPALTSFSFNERNVSITTYSNPLSSFRFITPLMCFPCH